MTRSEGCYICLPCWDENGKVADRATHRLVVRAVGEKWGEEVWGCPVHLAELCANLLRTERPLDLIVHNMLTGACVIEAHPRPMG